MEEFVLRLPSAGFGPWLRQSPDSTGCQKTNKKKPGKKKKSATKHPFLNNTLNPSPKNDPLLSPGGQQHLSNHWTPKISRVIALSDPTHSTAIKKKNKITKCFFSYFLTRILRDWDAGWMKETRGFKPRVLFNGE